MTSKQIKISDLPTFRFPNGSLSLNRFNFHQVHDYTQCKHGIDYVFELADDNKHGYMTTQSKGVKPGDCVIILQCEHPVHFKVKTVDYYSSPSNMWTAELVKIDSQP